jgi:hypothetical protein
MHDYMRETHAIGATVPGRAACLILSVLALPQMKGLAIGNMEKIKDVHNSFARCVSQVAWLGWAGQLGVSR